MLRLKDEDDDFLDISLDELDAALAGWKTLIMEFNIAIWLSYLGILLEKPI